MDKLVIKLSETLNKLVDIGCIVHTAQAYRYLSLGEPTQKKEIINSLKTDSNKVVSFKDAQKLIFPREL